MIQVVHLQTHLPTSGNAAFRLHKALVQRGIDSTMLSLSSDVATSDNINHLRMRAQLVSIANDKIQYRKTRNIKPEFGMFSYPVLGNNISNHKLILKADIIYLHWAIGGFLNLKNMAQIARLKKPIIIFMHDMWHITGGCHHSFGCENFKIDCSDCQMFPEKSQNTYSVKGFGKKKKFYDTYENLYFVAPSRWLYNLAKMSALTRQKPIYYIPNIVGEEPFKPLDKKMARALFGLNETDTIVAFGAASPNSPYKGWKYLRQALEILSGQLGKDALTVVVFGADADDEMASAIPFETRFLGRLRDNYSTAQLYNAADVFVAPSVAETFGLVILEALRCQTPVVAFNTGGVPDLITHKSNGYLAKYRDAEDLARGIAFCLKEKMESFAPSQFDTGPVIERHLELYDFLLKSKPSR